MKTDEEQAVNLLWKWYRRCLVAQIAHYSCAALYTKFHYCLGFPSIALTTAVGSSIFASMNEADGGGHKLLFGVMSILATSLAAMQTFLRYSERGEAHRTAAVRYSALKREIEHYTVFLPDNLSEVITAIRNEWDTLAGDCEIIPDTIFHMAERRVYNGKGIATKGHPSKPGATPTDIDLHP